jgi:phosphatidylglycerophosphate synthase
MLGCTAASIVWRDARFAAAGGLVGLALRSASVRGMWTPSGKLGAANTITLLRLGLVASLPSLFVALPRLPFVALLLGVLALDSLDGPLARARGEASPFGAALDMECDALTAMVLTLLLWLAHQVAAWVLIAGLWRYVYAAIVALVPSLGEAPRTRFGRWVFTVLALSLAGAFLPLPIVPTVLAAVGTAAVSVSFGYSLARSRAGAGSAASSSAAASDQARRGSRAA